MRDGVELLLDRRPSFQPQRTYASDSSAGKGRVIGPTDSDFGQIGAGLSRGRLCSRQAPVKQPFLSSFRVDLPLLITSEGTKVTTKARFIYMYICMYIYLPT